MANPSSAPRLASLDILRGFDLFMLVFFQPIVIAFTAAAAIPGLEPVLRQFDHEVWDGFRAWDMVMPLFLFITGAAMPFSMQKYLAPGCKPAAYRKILRRVVVLYLLGGVVQGNFLGLDPQRIYLYSNTLQAIASGYLIAAILQLHFKPRNQLIACGVLLLIYWIPMTFCGDWTPRGNFADLVDQAVLGRFRDCTYPSPDGGWVFNADYTYTWIWSSLTFGVTAMMGVFAGRMLKERPAAGMKNVRTMLLWGAACIGAALLWDVQMPVNKRIWSCSMVLLSGGICYLMLAGVYYLTDCKGFRGADWLKIYGMNSITAYVLGEAVDFRCVVNSLTYGLEKYTGEFYPALLSLGNYTIVFLILWWMYRRRIFLKI